MGSYEGRHTGVWVFNDLLYTGAEDLEVFDPAKPNINIVESGNGFMNKLPFGLTILYVHYKIIDCFQLQWGRGEGGIKPITERA